MKISIAIPTRERAEYLAASLRTCVAIDDPDVEIIVSDNASTDDTRVVVAGFNDPRIRYVNIGKRVSQRQNFENALNASSGDYVMMIGDDDAVLPGQFARLKAILDIEKPEALSWPAIFYQWPAAHKRAGGGMLRLRKTLLFGNTFTRTREEQTRAICELERTREDFSPKLYHGVLSRRVIERLRAKTGDVIMGGQIDAYIATAALAVMERYLYVRHPFSIMAMGPRSGGSSVLEQFRPGTANDTLSRVVAEGEDDPVREILNGPFPTLGFYLLAGVVQANHHVHDNALKIHFEKYFSMISEQFQIVPQFAQDVGTRILNDFSHADSLEASSAFEKVFGNQKKTRLHRPLGRIRIELPQALAPFQRFLESQSYISAARVVLDLKPRGGGGVDDAVTFADALIGSHGQARLEIADAPRFWRNTQMRCARMVVGGSKAGV